MTNQPSQQSDNKQKRRRAFQKGVVAEWISAFYLMLKGYRIMAMRYKTRHGEIDIIARKGTLVAIVEVKARPDVAAAFNAVTWTAQQRINRTADDWTAKQDDGHQLTIRFDVIAVIPWRMPMHLKDAF